MTASALRCAVVCDGERGFAGRAWQVVVGVTGAFGGGGEIGATRPDDGLLDVAVVPAGSRLGLARRALGMRRSVNFDNRSFQLQDELTLCVCSDEQFERDLERSEEIDLQRRNGRPLVGEIAEGLTKVARREL
jgi:diacylglycerol kinase family enzyme